MSDDKQFDKEQPLWERLRFLVKERRHVQIGVVEDELLAAAHGLEYASLRLKQTLSARGETYREIGTLHRTRDGIMHATTMPDFGMELHSAVPIFVKDGGKSET